MSKIVAIMPVRNEAWIIGLSVRALLMWCDEIIIGLHECTDATVDIVADIVKEFPRRVDFLSHTGSTWREMEHRQHLLFMARECGASHVAIVDCDEIVSGNLLPDIRRMVEATPRGSVLQLPWVQLKGSIHTYIASGMWSQQCASTAFPDDPAYHWAARDGYDHHHRHPMGRSLGFHMPMGRGVNSGGLFHMQMLCDRRLKIKQYWYQLVERSRWPDRETAAQVAARYTPTVEAPGQLSRVPDAWWEPYRSLMCHLDLSAEPWQVEECRRLIRENPGIVAGLNNFGVEL